MVDTVTDGASPAPAEDETAAAAAADTDANDTAASSEADTGAKAEPENLFDAVTAALEGSKGPDASPASDRAEEGKEPAEGAAAEGDDPAADEPEVPKEFHKHPAWQRITRQRDELRGPAEQYRKIEGFMEAQRLSPEEVVEGYRVMALIKNDPAKALDVLSEYVDQLSGLTGRTMPADLAEKVRRGQIDQQTAEELARTRATGRLTEQQLAEQRQAETARRVDETKAQVREAVGRAEASIRERDPDYGKKEKLVQDRVRAIVQETGKSPQTVDEAVVLLKTAYRDVNALMKDFMPPRQGTNSPPASSSATATDAPPKTLSEAIQRAVNVA
ncbi:MAG: hypothetical protein RJQ08_03840 [Salinisphaeraceae bacterium]